MFVCSLPADVEALLSSGMQSYEKRDKIKELLIANPQWFVVKSRDLRIMDLFKNSISDLRESYYLGMRKLYHKDLSAFKARIVENRESQIAMATSLFRKLKDPQVFEDCQLDQESRDEIFSHLAYDYRHSTFRKSSRELRLEEYREEDRLEILSKFADWDHRIFFEFLETHPFTSKEWLLLAEKKPYFYLLAISDQRIVPPSELFLCEKMASNLGALCEWSSVLKLNQLICDSSNRQKLYEELIKKDPEYLLTSYAVLRSPDQKREIALAYASSGDVILKLDPNAQEEAFDFLLDPDILNLLLSKTPPELQGPFRESIEQLRTKHGKVFHFLNVLQRLSEESERAFSEFKNSAKNKNPALDAQSWNHVGSLTNSQDKTYLFFEPKEQAGAKPPFPAVEPSPLQFRRWVSPDESIFRGFTELRKAIQRIDARAISLALGCAIDEQDCLAISTVETLNRNLKELVEPLGVPFKPIHVSHIGDDPLLDVDRRLIREVSEGRFILSSGRFFLHDMLIHVQSWALLKLTDALKGTSGIDLFEEFLSSLKDIEGWLSQLEERRDESQLVDTYLPFWRCLLAAACDETLTLLGMYHYLQGNKEGKLQHWLRLVGNILEIDVNWIQYLKDRFPALFKQDPGIFTRQGFEALTEKFKRIVPLDTQ